jgi:hypothetical protein
MAFKKSIGLGSMATMAALVGSFAYGCSSTTTSGGGTDVDSGTGPAVDSGVRHDSGTGTGTDSGTPVDAGGTTGSCSPADVSGFTAPAYHNAKTPTGACTQAYIDAFYTGCLAAGSTQATCAPFGSGADASHKACAACIVSADTAAQYGALVEHKGTVSLNVAGCMEIKDPTGGLACAKSYQASEACTDAACAANCPVTDDASFQLYQACVQQASSNGCKTYTTAAACADAEAEAGAATVCFQGQTFQDLYNSIVPVFCLGAAGGG